MSRKRHIRKSIYNDGKLDIEHVLPNELTLDELTAQRNRLKHTLDNLLWHDDIKPGNLNIYSKYYLPQVNAENLIPEWNPSCPVTYDRTLNVVALNSFSTCDNFRYIRSNSIHEYLIANHPSTQITSINEELRTLKLELKKKFSIKLLNKVRKLVQELYSIISFFFSKQRKYVKRLRVSSYGSFIRDIRKTYRQTIQNIFKNLPDFSGCEEEAKFTTIVNFKPLFLNKQSNHVQYKIFT